MFNRKSSRSERNRIDMPFAGLTSSKGEMDDFCAQMQSLLSTGPVHNSDVDDAELERELLALAGEDDVTTKMKIERKSSDLDPLSLDPRQLIAQMEKEDENVSDVDENDQELLNELASIEGGAINNKEKEDESKIDFPVTQSTDPSDLKLISERSEAYQKAIETCGDDKTRLSRLNRQLKNILDLEEKAKSGKQVDLANLPPFPPIQQIKPIETTTKNSPLMDQLQKSRESFQKQLDSCEDSCKQRRLQRVLKQYDSAIECQKTGKPFNYAGLPEAIGVGPLPTPKQEPPSLDKLKTLAVQAKRRGELSEAKKYMMEIKKVNIDSEPKVETPANQRIRDQLVEQLTLASVGTNDPAVLEDARKELRKFEVIKNTGGIRFHYEDREIAGDASVDFNSLVVKVKASAELAGRFLRVTYPFPKDKHSVVSQRISAENAADLNFIFRIDRNDFRPNRRSHRRKDISFELVSRRGLFNLSERVEASAQIPLTNLEESCQYRCSALSLCLRRKTIASLDVSVHVRYPLNVQKTQLHRWLVLDARASSSPRPTSLQLINFASVQIERSLELTQDKGKRRALESELANLSSRRNTLVNRLKSGGQPELVKHLSGLESLVKQYELQAKSDPEAARQASIKIKLIGKELETFRKGLH